jgi:hypothetical protein
MHLVPGTGGARQERYNILNDDSLEDPAFAVGGCRTSSLDVLHSGGEKGRVIAKIVPSPVASCLLTRSNPVVLASLGITPRSSTLRTFFFHHSSLRTQQSRMGHQSRERRRSRSRSQPRARSRSRSRSPYHSTPPYENQRRRPRPRRPSPDSPRDPSTRKIKQRKSRNGRSLTSPPIASLPFGAQPISKRDLPYFRPMFELYLDIQKQKVIEDLSEDEVKGRWKSFVGKW